MRVFPKQSLFSHIFFTQDITSEHNYNSNEFIFQMTCCQKVWRKVSAKNRFCCCCVSRAKIALKTLTAAADGETGGHRSVADRAVTSKVSDVTYAPTMSSTSSGSERSLGLQTLIAALRGTADYCLDGTSFLEVILISLFECDVCELRSRALRHYAIDWFTVSVVSLEVCLNCNRIRRLFRKPIGSSLCYLSINPSTVTSLVIWRTFWIKYFCFVLS